MNPYSELFNPGKYFAYTRRPEQTTCLVIAEDNEAVIKIIKKARSMELRHLPRTHRIDVHWLFEVCSNPRVRMRYVNTKQQVADLMTKSLNNPVIWVHLLDIAQIRPGITAPNGSKPAMLASPPGLGPLVADVDCTDCGFDLSLSGSLCPCTWT